MLKIINGDSAEVLDYDNYYITEKYNGVDELGFSIPTTHPGYPLITEEITIEENQRYLVKAIDEGAQNATIKCEIDLDALKAEMFVGYSNESDTVRNTIQKILPKDWTLEDHAYLNIRRTVTLEAGTAFDIISACESTYGVTARYDNRKNIVHLYLPEQNQPAGAYLTDELNLKQVNYKGKSADFITRLYAYGKDGLSFADINDGKPYVEDHTYSDKIVCGYWRDERYTIKENLLEDAKRNLAQSAIPQRSYECSAIDLAEIKESTDGKDQNIYSFLDLSLYNVVTLLDRKRKTRINHQIVEKKRYPHYPENNVVTLSTVAPSVQNSVRQIQNQIQNPTSDFRTIMQATIDTMTEVISGALGGNFIITLGDNGKPNGWAILDTDSIETAKEVWRFTAGGLGHSSTGFNGPFSDYALTKDGKINASMILVGELWANLIKSGRIQGRTANGPYFDLDANNGQGELAASVLKGVGDGSTTTARIGFGTYAGGGTYEGMRINTASGAGGAVTIAMQREQGDYTLANDAELVSLGNLVIRSQGIVTNPGGNNSINMTGNSTTGEGKIRIARGARSSSETVLLADNAQTNIAFNGRSALVATDDYTTIYKNGNPIFFGDDTNTYIRSTNGIIQFQTGGYARASIEKNGSAYFGYLYTNGTLVTSDRAKKKNIKAIRTSALDMVKKAKAYEYVLKEDEKKRIGIMYDEAPECIRSDEERKAVDLYGMITLLWKAVQELEQKIDNIKEGKILST